MNIHLRKATLRVICSIGFCLAVFAVLAFVSASACADEAQYPAELGAAQLIPPPEPGVRPDIPVFAEIDADHNRLDDRLDLRLNEVRNALASATNPAMGRNMQAQLGASTPVEFVFSKQITQKQIDDFVALGGTISYIYQAVSYGWNGSVPLGSLEKFRDAMGESLVGIAAEKEVVACMDQAGRTGRVRPVWVAGFAGNAGGITGASTTTICIMDTGVDDSHTDLTGRQEFWHDYTSAGLATPADVNGHGSHCAGIATGSGASMGSSAATLYYTDSGDMSSLASGYFYPTAMHIPNGVATTLTSIATWVGGGTATLYQVYQADGSTASYSAISAATSGTSPVTEANSFTASSANHYSPALLQNATRTVGRFAVANSATNFPGVGDGFNTLRGVASGARWAGARVLSDSGSGSSIDINAALDDMVVQRSTHNIKIVSMSFGTNGTPGLDTTERAKVNTMVNNGIIALVAAGNDGPGTAGANLVDDPGRAALAITVGASNDVNQVTQYTSSGFTSPGATEDYKPDLLAPGGSDYYSNIMSVDTNDADAEISTFADRRANDYKNIKGTSMATPFAAGAAALVIQALENHGVTWSFSSSAHPLLVKMLLCATSTETNAAREVASGTDPTLGRAATPKDLYEGYGILNLDAAVEAASLSYTGGALTDSSAGGYYDRRAWARNVVLIAGGRVNVSLTVPGAGDYDMYLYSGTPDSKGNPVIRASSTNTSSGTSESIDYTSVSGETLYLVIKRVSGSGTWSLTGTVVNDSTPPTVTDVTSNLANGSYRAGQVVDVRVTFSENVTYTPGTGVAQIQLETGTTDRQAVYASGSGTSTLVFNYTIQAGDTSSDLDYLSTSALALTGTATIRDAAGNDATRTLASPGATHSLGYNKAIVIDTTAPTVTSVNRQTPSSQNTNATSVTWRVTFGEAVNASTVSGSDFTLTDVSSSLSGESISSTSPASGSTTTIDVTANTGSGDGTLRLDVMAAATINDAAGNDYSANYTSGQTYIVDKTAPTVGSVNRQTPSSQNTNAASVTWRVTFSEAVDASTVSGSDFTLTDVSGSLSGESISSTTPSSGSTTTIDVTANTGSGDGTLRLDVLTAATIGDAVGNDYNSNYTSGQTYIIDKTAPTIAHIDRLTPPEQYTSAASVVWRVIFSESVDASTVSGSDFTLTDVSSSISGESVTSTTPTSGSTTTIDVTANTGSGDGTLRLDVLTAATISDAVGNDYSSNYTSGQTYVIDKTAPTIEIGAPSVPLTRGGPVTFTITYGGADTVTLEVANVTLNKTGTADGTVEVTGTGTTTRTVTISGITGDGTLGISIASGTASDNAGNTAPGAGPSTTFDVDNTAPTIEIGVPSASLTRGGPVTYTVTYGGADSVTLEVANVTLNKTGTADGTVEVTGTGTTTRTVTISSITGDGTLGISIASGTAADDAGNTAPSAGPSDTFTVDNTTPTIEIGVPSASLTRGGPVTYTVTYAGADTVTLTAENVTLDKTGTADGTVEVTGSGTATRTVTVSGITGDGALGISVASGTAADDAGNAAPAAGPSDTFSVDNTSPTIEIGAPSVSPTSGGPVTFAITYGGADSITLAPGDVTLNKTGSADGTVAVSGTGTTTRTVTISGITGDGTLGISVAAGTAADDAGNTAPAAGSSATFAVDNTPPTVTISAPSASTTAVGPVSYTVTYADTGGIGSITLVPANVTLNKTGNANGTVAVTGSGNTRTVTISSISGKGTLGISITAGTASDTAGNAALAAGPSTTFNVLAPPVNVSITPNSGAVSFGSPMTFTTVSSDPNGYANIKEIRLLLNDSALTAGTVLVKYIPASNTLWLRDDPSVAWLGPITPGAGTTLENSQGILHAAATTVTRSGNNMTIAWSITVKSTMSTKQVQGRLLTVDFDGNEDTWDVLASYYTNVPPTNTSLTPSSGGLPTGSEFVLRAVYSDGNGASDCKQCYLLVSDTGAQANSMSLHYDRQANKVRLRADNGSTWSLGYVIGSPGVVLENSQCKLYVERTTVSASGNNLTIDWHVELKAVMAGKKLTGTMSVYDALLTGRADVRGVYFNNLAPVNVSVTPGSGSLAIGSPMTLSTVYRDGNGAVDLYQCMFLLSENGSSVNSVSLFYIKATNKLYLRNDAGTAWLGGYTPGSAGVIENSQCKVYASGSTVSTSGTDLTIGWRVELKPTMTGKNLTGAMTVIDSTSVTVTNVRGVYYTNHAPLNTSVTPNSGSISTGVPTVYTTVYTDADGGGTIRQANFLINTTSGLTNGVLVKYDATANKVYLRNDANTAWSTGYVPGTVMTLENSQCKLYVAGTTATAVGSDLTIDWSIELKPTMAAKTLREYMWVTDAPYASAGYDLRGTFTTP